MNKKIKPILLITIFSVISIILIALIFKNFKNDTSIKKEEPSVRDWLNIQIKNEYSITVFSATDCEYCKNYEPTIKNYANKKNITLFYFQIDTLSDEDLEILLTTYPINIQGTPYTIITKNSEILKEILGSQNDKDLENMLVDIIH